MALQIYYAAFSLINLVFSLTCSFYSWNPVHIVFEFILYLSYVFYVLWKAPFH